MYADGLGLYLKVRLGNSKAGTSDIASPANCGDMGLGPLHTVSLAQAREQAEVCRVMRLKGLDPLEERLKEQQAKRLGPITFEKCAETYIATHKDGWKNAKHADMDGNASDIRLSPLSRLQGKAGCRDRRRAGPKGVTPDLEG